MVFGCSVLLKQKKINSTIANALFVAMETRETVLLQNEVFLSALYLDARYQCLLSADSKIKAIKHLCKVWWEAQEFLENSHCVQDQLLSNNSPTNNAINSDVDDDLEKLIQTKSLSSSEESSTFCQETQQYETGEV